MSIFTSKKFNNGYNQLMETAKKMGMYNEAGVTMPKSFEGRYGTNQNYEGPGGFNYAKPNQAPNQSMIPEGTALVPTNTGKTFGPAKPTKTTTTGNGGSYRYPPAVVTPTTPTTPTAPTAPVNPPTSEELRSNVADRFQEKIDAINAYYKTLTSRAEQRGNEASGKARAMAAAGGTLNSPMGGASIARSTEDSEKDIAQYGAENLLKVGEVKDAEGKAAQEALTSYASGDYEYDSIPREEKQRILDTGAFRTEAEMKSYFKAQKAAAELKGQFNLNEGEARYDNEGNVIAERAKTFAPSSGSSAFTGTISAGAEALAKQIQSGQATLANVPSAMRAEVAAALNQLPNPKVTEIDSLIGIIDELKSNPKLDNITGPIDQFAGGIFGKAAVAKNLYKQLEAALSLNGREKLKGSGAISDFEANMLKQASAAIGRNLSAADLKIELDKVRKVLADRKNVLSGTETANSEDIPSDEEIQQLIDEGYAVDREDALRQLGLTNVGGDTNLAISIPQSSHLAYVNNNPGNLKYVGQPGSVPGKKGFAKFSTPQAGYDALVRQIKLDANRGLTIAQFVSKYAPPTENDTRQYIAQVASATGAGPNTPINRINVHSLAKVVAMKESSTRIA